MRILDRYAARQVLPVWIWCLAVFVFVSCLIDLFEHLDEILRYHIPARTVWQYYLNFMPLVFVRASPFALLLSSAFVAMRLARHQELLAMSASGVSILRASIPFLFVGWVASVVVFVVNERVVPQTALVYERLRQETFRGHTSKSLLENPVIMDAQNRLYHARLLDPAHKELTDLTILEHDAQNRPKKTIYAQRAISTPHGWLLLTGTVYRLGPRGALVSNPEPFVERLMTFPVSLESFQQPDVRVETMRYAQLRQLISRLHTVGITNVRRYAVELASKITLPLMNMVVCLIGFVGSTTSSGRGHLQGLGTGLGWGVAYYIGVAIGQGLGKEGLLPVALCVWTPHLATLALCVRTICQRG